MESHGEAGSIQISAQTAELLQGRFEMQRRGMVPIKGKGDLETFTLVI
jgi:class 3 adenylate cyclase